MLRVFLAAVALLCTACRVVAEHDAASPHHAHHSHQHHFDDCRYQRADVLACALRYGDHNGDGHLDAGEIEAMMQRHLSATLRAGVWLGRLLSSKVPSAAAIVAGCDGDGDGRISADDFARTTATCVSQCSHATHVMEQICHQAAAAAEREAHDKHGSRHF